jgi:hypothetical protein
LVLAGVKQVSAATAELLKGKDETLESRDEVLEGLRELAAKSTKVEARGGDKTINGVVYWTMDPAKPTIAPLPPHYWDNAGSVMQHLRIFKLLAFSIGALALGFFAVM